MSDVLAFVRAPLVADLWGAPRRDRHADPWLDLLTARARGEEYLLGLGKGEKPNLSITISEHEHARLAGRAAVTDGKVYLYHEGHIRGRARIAALMLSPFDGWLLVVNAPTFEPLTVRLALKWFPVTVEPWWRQWPATERQGGILGDELPFVAWKTAGLSPAIAKEAEAIGDPSPRAGGPIHAIVCTRGRKTKPKACSACGTANAELLCDYPVGKKTCSKPICESCTHRAGKLDLCPEHAATARTTSSSFSTAQGALFGATPPSKTQARPADGTLDLFGPQGKA